MALLGPSGSGKTTFLEALAHLRQVEGSIRLGGRELADWEEDALREALAYVPQRPHLFAGTIADNIRFGHPSASDADVGAAALRACVASFAQGLPDGLDTVVGENGLGLSGGERHRVALARLYLRDPGLILLDEPTAHLDAETARLVMEGLLDFARGRTLLIATHSVAVAQCMGNVLHIRNLCLVSGTPSGANHPVCMENAA